MKSLKIALFTAFLLFTLRLSALDVSVDYATFMGKDLNYVELYLHVAGKSIQYSPINDSLKVARLQVVVLFKQGDKIVKFDKFQLQIPPTKKPIDIVDLKRYALQDGDYQMEVEVQDQANVEGNSKHKVLFSLNYTRDFLSQSDIQLLGAFHKIDSSGIMVKNGFYLEPLPYKYYGSKASTIQFYCELYNTDNAIQEDYMVVYNINKVENDSLKSITVQYKRKKAAPVVPILQQLDISQLESGNYNLVIEIRDRSKKLLSSKHCFFQRSNPQLNHELSATTSKEPRIDFTIGFDKEQLSYSLRAITPIMPQTEVEYVNTIMNKNNLKAQRLYLASFWNRVNPKAPEEAYDNFMKVAKAVDNTFQSGFRHGFETDRGYIYLKYGQPNNIIEQEEEPSAPPYEIWIYNEFPRTGQNNVKFLFYNPSLAPGDYELLHSTARGERNNPQWQLELYRDAPAEINGNSIDATQVQDNFNRRAAAIFRDN